MLKECYDCGGTFEVDELEVYEGYVSRDGIHDVWVCQECRHEEANGDEETWYGFDDGDSPGETDP